MSTSTQELPAVKGLSDTALTLLVSMYIGGLCEGWSALEVANAVQNQYWWNVKFMLGRMCRVRTQETEVTADNLTRAVLEAAAVHFKLARK
jgi:hypothetical protein